MPRKGSGDSESMMTTSYGIKRGVRSFALRLKVETQRLLQEVLSMDCSDFWELVKK
jgi:hypothetical protein